MRDRGARVQRAESRRKEDWIDAITLARLVRIDLLLLSPVKHQAPSPRKVDDADGNGLNLGDLRGAKTPCPGDDLKAPLADLLSK
jgi:hypothetical protein